MIDDVFPGELLQPAVAGEAGAMGLLKRVRWPAAMILSLLCASGWAVPTDSGLDTHEATIAAQLSMDEAEGRKFWPIFREYRYELAKLDDTRGRLLDDFSEHAGALSAAQAREWIEGWLDNRHSRVKLTDRFVKRCRRVLPEAKVARLVILEGARRATEDARAVASTLIVGVAEEVAE